MTTRRLAAVLAACLVLTACSGTPDVTEPEVGPDPTTVGAESPTSEGTTTTDDQSSTPAETSTPAPPSTSTTAPSATGDPRGDPAQYNARAMAAVQRAEESEEAVAFQLDDRDDASWLVDVAVNTSEVEVLVSADGNEVLARQDRGILDDDDSAGLAAATVPMRQAIEIATGQVEGFVEDVDLDREGAAFVWVVSLDSQIDDVDVHVDVATGNVVRTDR